MLFVLGGNGTHAGANAIHNEVVTYHFKLTKCCSCEDGLLFNEL